MKKIVPFLMLAAVIITTPLFSYRKTKRRAMLTLQSTSFTNGSEIPPTFTCTGENISPHLQWKSKDNASIKSYTLIVDDPDAKRVVGKTFVHWIVLLPNTITELTEGASRKGASSVPGVELRNDFKMTQYGGPCPPKGTGVHTYRFTLFALNQTVEQLQQNTQLPPVPFSAEQFKSALKKQIVGETRITGTFSQ